MSLKYLDDTSLVLFWIVIYHEVYILKIVQSCRKKWNGDTCKINLYGSVFSTLLVFISYNTQGDDGLQLVFLGRVLHESEARFRSLYHVSGF